MSNIYVVDIYVYSPVFFLETKFSWAQKILWERYNMFFFPCYNAIDIISNFRKTAKTV